MAKLYRIASFCFDVSLYLRIYVSYIVHEGPLSIILNLIFFISLLLLAFPSSYYRRGYQISFKRVEVLGYIKMFQLFVFFIMMPALGKERITITLFILVITTILSWVNQIKIYKQIKELITFEKIVDKVLNQTVRAKELVKQHGIVGYTIFIKTIIY